MKHWLEPTETLPAEAIERTRIANGEVIPAIATVVEEAEVKLPGLAHLDDRARIGDAAYVESRRFLAPPLQHSGFIQVPVVAIDAVSPVDAGPIRFGQVEDKGAVDLDGTRLGRAGEDGVAAILDPALPAI